MPKFILPLIATLLLTSACCPHRKPCPSRYCPPTAPTRCHSQAAPQNACPQKPTRKACHNRCSVPLSRVTDYLPGVPPGYTIYST